MSTPQESNEHDERLDKTQYSEDNIMHYEIIFGQQFVSTGGKNMVKKFAETLNLENGAYVLDFGCGLGGSAFYFAEHFNAKVLGIDVSENMLQKANKYLQYATPIIQENVKFRLSDGSAREEFPEESFNAIVSFEVLVHIATKEDLFRRFHSWLKPKGKLLISDYCLGSSPNTEDFQNYIKERNYRMIEMTEYKVMLEKVGFSNISIRNQTSECIKILNSDVEKFKANKPSLLQTLSPQTYEKILIGWRKKLKRCECENQRWILIQAEK